MIDKGYEMNNDKRQDGPTNDTSESSQVHKLYHTLTYGRLRLPDEDILSVLATHLPMLLWEFIAENVTEQVKP